MKGDILPKGSKIPFHFISFTNFLLGLRNAIKGGNLNVVRWIYGRFGGEKVSRMGEGTCMKKAGS